MTLFSTPSRRYYVMLQDFLNIASYDTVNVTVYDAAYATQPA